MKVALATHALRGYPPRVGGTPTRKSRRNLFSWAQEKGFDGIEVGDWWFDFYTAEADDLVQLKQEMSEYGLEMAGFNCLRKCVTHPTVGKSNKRDLRRTIELAKVSRPSVVSISLSLAPEASGTPEDRVRGLQTSPGGGAEAKEEEFVEAAAFLRELAEEAAVADVQVALELHHCSLADTSHRLLHILELANHPNLGANPDLGNLYWAYEEPEEPWYETVDRLAGKVNLWHVKSVQRIHVPEVERSFFVHASLEEGDIDYRWALARFVAAGFDGYISVEGAGPGDLLSFAARGKAYLDGLLEELASGNGLEVW